MGYFAVHEHQHQARHKPQAMGFPDQLLYYSNQSSGVPMATLAMAHGRQIKPEWLETHGNH